MWKITLLCIALNQWYIQSDMQKLAAKKALSDSLAHKIHPVEIAVHLLAFTAFTFYAMSYLLNISPIWPIAVTIYLTMAAAVVTTLQGRSSLLLRSSIRVVTFVIVCVLLILTYAVWQDLQHVRCTGLFGATTTCFDSWSFTAFALVFASPVALILLAVVICMGMGLYETNKSSANDTPHKKRTP